MSTLEKRHILGTGTSAVLGGAVAGLVGYLVGGPPILAVGAVIGTAAGALIGRRSAAAADPQGDIGHFEEIYGTMPYYVDGMEWSDYEPAYRFGLDTYRTRGGQAFADAEAALGARWLQVRGESRLTWNQARAVVEHVWREMDDTLKSRGRA